MFGPNSNFDGCTSSGHIKAHHILLHRLHSLSKTCSSYRKIKFNTFNLLVRVSFQGHPFNSVGSKVKYFKVNVAFYCSL